MVKAALAKHMIKAAQDSGTPATPATPSTAPLTDVSGNTIAGHLRNAQSSATAHRARQDAEVAHMARMNQDALASLSYHPHRQMFESSALKNSKMPDKFQDKDNDFMIPNFYAGVSAPDPRNRTYANRVPMAPARRVFNQMYGRHLSSDEYNWAMSHFLDKFEKGHSGPIGAGAR